MFAIRTTLATFILLILGATYAQESTMVLHDEKSTDLISELRKQKREELKAQNYPPDSDHGATYRQLTNYLIRLVNKEHLVNDKEINELVYAINDRLVASNPEIRKIKKILIHRNGFQNAASYGEGTITLNLGLIACAKSEEELAFTIAHEIAHYHLDHLRDNIQRFVSKKSTAHVMKRIRKIPTGNISVEDLEFVQSWFGYLLNHSQESELEADVIAMRMMKNCGYSNEAGEESLRRLEIAYIPTYPLKKDLFEH